LKATSTIVVSNVAAPSPVYTTSIVKGAPGHTVNVLCMPGVVGSRSMEMIGIAGSAVTLNKKQERPKPTTLTNLMGSFS
jgi:hypothetical protein